MSGSTKRVAQCDGSQRRQERFEIAFEVEYKEVDLHVLEFQSVKARESGKVIPDGPGIDHLEPRSCFTRISFTKRVRPSSRGLDRGSI